MAETGDSSSKNSEVRDAMKVYWDHWVKDASKSGDFLKIMVSEEDPELAKDIHKADIAELTSLVPDLTDKDVLELASGVGRMSSVYAKRARHVTSTDMMESFVAENKKTNGSVFSNMTFQVLDATKIDFPPNSFDVVIFVWLLLYLNDAEMENLVNSLLKFLKPDGQVFFREANFTHVGSRVQTDEGNPAIYRTIMEFMNVFKNCRYTDENNDTYMFQLDFAVNSRTYISLKGIPTVVYYLWKKTKVDVDLDKERDLSQALYSEGSLQVYSKVIGDGFTTPGGLNAAKDLVAKMNLNKDDRLLDVGCGLGGLTAFLIKEYSLDVTGLDISSVAGQAAILNFKTHEFRKGQIHIANLLSVTFSENEFNAILALDTLKYIGEKDGLLKKFKSWLKPSGQLLLSDYCSAKACSNLTEAVGINLVSVDTYIKYLRNAGFLDVTIKDYSKQQMKFIEQDLMKLESEENIDAEVKKTFSSLWKVQLDALKSGEIAFIVYLASAD